MSSPTQTAATGIASQKFAATVRRWWAKTSDPSAARGQAGANAGKADESGVAEERETDDAAGASGWFDSSFDLRSGLSVVEVFEA